MKNTLVIILFAMTAVGCGGDAEAGQAFWQAIVAHLLEIVVLIATPILLILARKLISLMETKWGIDISEKQELMVDEWLSKGVAYAHEQGRKALKDGDEPIPGDEKKIMAVEFVAAGLRASGVVSMSRDALAKLVEAKLNRERYPDDTSAPMAIEGEDEEEEE